jgi:hypothetical protein
MSGISQLSDSATSISGTSDALYKLSAIEVGGMVAVSEGFGVTDGTGEGDGSTGSGVLGAQETISIINNRETRMRARLVIGENFVNYVWTLVRCPVAD